MSKEFEQKAREAAIAHEDGEFSATYRSINYPQREDIRDAYFYGMLAGNADREAYASERVREEQERILALLKGDEAREYEIWFNKNNPRDPDADDWAHWLEARLKADAGGEQE